VTSTILFALIAVAVVAGGCRRQATEQKSSVGSLPEVHLVNPQLRNLTCTVDQPGFVDAFEQTAIYSKVSGFIQHYYVDIGDQVKKGAPLADIFVPELNEEHEQKVAQLKLDRSMVHVAETKVQTAIAQLAEANANVGKYQADIVRWESEVQRLTRMLAERVVDREVLDETQKQLSSSRSARDAALATVKARAAAQASAEADLQAAKDQVNVAEAEERRTAAMLAYTKVTSPYDGVVTVRNANTGDLVYAATGDRSGSLGSAMDKSASAGSPMFVVARDDLVRIFVDVPEAYARYVRVGTKATVQAEALSGLEINAAVTRTSWSLHERTRTLRVEIDLPANDAGLRPGMYVNTHVIIQRSGVPMLPQDALVVAGNQTYCYLLEDGKAVKTPVVRGLREGGWVEVTKMKIDDPWVKVTGAENVILGDLDERTNGQAVKVVGKQGAANPPPAHVAKQTARGGSPSRAAQTGQ
jgi:multidrug efflux pump subunit AcrA (membrane-fusion protein)